jgi:hypothetical protein
MVAVICAAQMTNSITFNRKQAVEEGVSLDNYESKCSSPPDAVTSSCHVPCWWDPFKVPAIGFHPLPGCQIQVSTTSNGK